MRQKFISILCAFSLLFNSILPIFSAGIAYAEETTPSAEIASPLPTPSESSSLQPSAFDALFESPSPEPSVTPSPTPEVSPVATESPVPTTQPENIPSSSPTENTNQSNAPPSETSSPSSSPSASTTPEVSATSNPDHTSGVNLGVPLVQGHLEALIIKNTDSDSLELDLNPTNVSSASLTTDKGDYAPTDTVIISGTEFLPNTEYTLLISSSDEPAVNFETKITTSDSGSFIYRYQLDGNYRPNYQVEVTDSAGNVAATTTFTDSITYTDSNDSAGPNDEPGQKDLTRLGRDLTSSDPLYIYWNWDVVSMSGNNTADACALFDTNNNGLADYSLCVTWKTNQSQNAGSPTLYSCNDTRVDRCAGNVLITTSLSSTCSVANATDDPFTDGDSYPNDTKATCSISLSDVGGAAKASLLDVCSYPSVQPNSDPSDCIIIRSDKGNLTVIKDVSPDDATTNWDFAVTGPTNFNASINGDGSSGINSVDLGTYSVTETAGSNTSLGDYNTTWSCTKNGSAYLSGSGTTASNIVLGKSGSVEDSVVCTFTNTLNQGSLTVIKHVVGGTATASNWTMHVNQGSTQDIIPSFPGAESPGTNNTLVSGSYTVTESGGPSDYTLSYSGDCDSSGNVTVTMGSTKTCTLTNIRDTGTLTVNKTLNPSSDTGLFNLQIDGATAGTGANVGNGGTTGSITVATGSHTVGETAGTSTSLSNYSSSISCSNGQNATGTNLSVTVAKNDNITCTISNSRNTGTLQIIKNVDLNGDGDYTDEGESGATDWTWDISGGEQNIATGQFRTLNTGSYTISEDPKANYHLVDWSCSDGTSGTTNSISANVVKDTTLTCTIYNARDTGTLTVNKILVPSSDSGRFDLKIDGTTYAVGVGNTGSTGQIILQTGSHTVSEAGDGAELSDYLSVISGDCDEQGNVTVTAGSNKVCTITNSRKPKLTVHKEVINHGGNKTTADFAPYQVDGNTVTLDTAEEFSIGSHTVTEATDSAYTSTFSGDCNSSGVVTLAAGDNKTCTITNEEKPAKVIVRKTVINHGLSYDSSHFAPYKVGDTEVTLGSETVMDSGTYIVSEATDPDYTAAFSGDCDANGNITLVPGTTKSCTITNEENQSTITVYKVVINHGLSYDASYFGPYKVGNITVTLGAATNINSGTYSVSETPDSNYTATFSGDCNEQGEVIITPASNKSCTITNEEKLSDITVHKNVINHGDSKVASDFGPYQVDSTVVTLDQATIFDSGSHTVTEATDSAYTTTFSGDCNANGVVTLGTDEHKTCTITNEEKPAKLIVTKVVIINNGGTKNIADFPLYVDGASVISGVTNTFDSGLHVVSETNQTGYSSTIGGDCDGNGNIILVAGQTKTCTITNDDQAALLNVIKVVNSGYGVSQTPMEFGLNVDGGHANPSAFLGSGAPGTPVILDAGDYRVYEATPSGYTVDYSADCSGTIGNGDTKTCTVTNTPVGPKLTLQKIVNADNGGTASASAWTLSADGPTPFSGQGPTVSSPASLNIGTYTLSESDGPDGYSASSWACTGDGVQNGNQITLALGEEAVCTITNNDIAPTLTLVKVLPNDNGGTATQDEFNVYINRELSSWGTHTLDAGSYTVGEDTLPGYEPSVWGGDCNGDGNVTLSPGDNKTCTITNDDIAPILTLVKYLPNDNGGTATENDFNVYIDGQSANWGQNTVDAGSLAVSEDTIEGYEPSVWGGDCDDDGNITLLPGDNKTCFITNDDQTGSITGSKWNDLDGNGERGEEPGLEEWHIQLFENNDGIKGAQVGSDAVTDSSGNYSFEEVNAGSYFVCEFLQNGWMQTYPQDPSCYEITVELDEPLTDLDFGNFKLGKISGKKFNDLDGNHVYTNTTTDPNLPNWTITLDKQNDSNPPVCISGTIVGELCVTTTNSSGNYAFNGLEPGTYIVAEEQQSGWTQTRPNVTYGGQGAQADGTYVLTIGSGDDIDNRDFGNQGRGTILIEKIVSPSDETEWDFRVTGERDYDLVRHLGDGDSTTLTDVPAANYTITETTDSNYTTTIDCGDDGSVTNNAIDFAVDPGEDVECTFTNTRNMGSLQVNKEVDGDGDGIFEGGNDEANTLGFRWRINTEGSNEMGSSQDVVTGGYMIDENIGSIKGFHFTGWFYTGSEGSCEDEESLEGALFPVNVTVSKDDTTRITLCNARDTGGLKVNKVADTDGDGRYDSVDPLDFKWGTSAEATDYAMGGQAQTLITGDYSVYENNIAGYVFTGWFPGEPFENQYGCTSLPEGDIYTRLPVAVTVASNESMEITLCNQVKDPILTITKSNNSGGLDLSPGGSVIYTLTIEATQSAALNVKVTDLLPKGFTYRSGSWTALSNINPGLSVLEPTYASPGTWNLGDMQVGEIITLTYTADINSSQQPGLYKDLAWAQGQSLRESTVLAQAQPQGFVDTNFVGTEVNVVKDTSSSVGVNVENIEKKQGEVLGASIVLPNTGANGMWLVLAGILLTFGVTSLALGVRSRRKHD